MLRLALVAVLAVVPSIASADVVGMPPPSCPDGSEGRVCHGNAYCAVDGCVTGSECESGDACVIRELCIETEMCFGLGGGTNVATVTAAGCGGCRGRCESHFVCAGGATPVDAGPPRVDAGRRDAGGVDAGSGGRQHVMYCGCSVPGRAGGPSALGAIVAAALALAIVRPRR